MLFKKICYRAENIYLVSEISVFIHLSKIAIVCKSCAPPAKTAFLCVFTCLWPSLPTIHHIKKEICGKSCRISCLRCFFCSNNTSVDSVYAQWALNTVCVCVCVSHILIISMCVRVCTLWIYKQLRLCVFYGGFWAFCLSFSPFLYPFLKCMQ